MHGKFLEKPKPSPQKKPKPRFVLWEPLSGKKIAQKTNFFGLIYLMQDTPY
jgi:hypothetical protein